MLAAAVRMIKLKSLRSIVRTSVSDALIVAFTFTVTVVVNLITAVAAGLLIASLVTIAALARGGRIEAMPLDEQDPIRENGGAARDGASDDLADDIVFYRLYGPWFFAATHRLLHGLGQIDGRRVVILSMAQLSALDITAARAISETITQLHDRGVIVLLAGVQPRHHRLLMHMTGAGNMPSPDRIHPDSASAITHARALISPPARPSH